MSINNVNDAQSPNNIDENERQYLSFKKQFDGIKVDSNNGKQQIQSVEKGDQGQSQMNNIIEEGDIEECNSQQECKIIQNQSLIDMEQTSVRRVGQIQSNGLGQEKEKEKDRKSYYMSQSRVALEDDYFVEDQQNNQDDHFALYSNDITKLKSYNMPFRFNQFFEFFLYHFIYFTFLGPLTVLVTRLRGKYLGRNLQFIGKGKLAIVQFINFCVSIVTLNFYFFLRNPTIDQSIYLFNLFSVIFLRCLQIATKYATFDPLKIKIYKQAQIQLSELLFDVFLQDWSLQTDKIIYEQLYYTQRFFDSDPNLFHIQFMVEPQNKTAERIASSKEKVDKQIEQRKTHKQTNPIGIINESQIYYNGYTILHFLIEEHKERSQNLRDIFSYVIKTLSFIRGMIPAIYALTMQFTSSSLGMYWNEYAINLLISSQIFTLHSAICLQIGFGLLDLRRKIGETNASKVLPTINILKKESLKGWSLIRKSVMEYGRSYANRVESLVAVMSLYAAVSTITVVLAYFKVITIHPILAIEFCFDSAELIIMVFLMIIWGASLNETFRAQIKNLHTNKIFIQDLLLVQEQYSQEGKSSTNFLYNKGLQIMRQNLKQNETEEEYLKSLLESYDYMISELEYDEANYPFKFLGIKITPLMIQSLFLALLSLASSVVLDYVNKKFNAIKNVSPQN